MDGTDAEHPVLWNTETDSRTKRWDEPVMWNHAKHVEMVQVGRFVDLNEFVCGNGGFNIVRFVNVKISGVLPLSVDFSIY